MMRQIFIHIWSILLLAASQSIYANTNHAIELQWIKAESLAVGGSQFSMLQVNNQIYTLGGLSHRAGDELLSLSDMVFNCKNTASCAPKSPMLMPRHAFTAEVVDGKIYVIGGLNVNQRPVEVVDVYLPDRDVWQRKNANLPTQRYGLASVTYRGKIYVAGGAMLDSTGDVKSSAVLEVYEPNKDTWENKKAAMPTPRHGLSLVELNGKIYAIGGLVSGNASFNAKQTVLPTVEVYDPIKDIWQKKQNMPTPRAWLTTFAMNQKLYAIGGKSSNDHPLNHVESYDPISDTWQIEKSLPEGLFGISSIVLDNQVTVAGGVNCNAACVSSKTFSLRISRSSPAYFSAQSIDSFFKEKWKANHIVPARQSDGDEFQRRVTLDILGRVPTPQEITNFSKHKNRSAFIEQLLSDKSFYKYWSEVFSSQIFGSGVEGFGHEKNATAKFIAQALAQNSGYHNIVTDIITSEPAPHLGANQINAGGLVGYYAAQLKNPKRIEALVNNVGRAFMGSQLHCAQCHDSHVDKRTTQTDYYGLIAFFSGFRVVDGKLVETSKVEYQPEKYSKSLSTRYLK